jgi:hypothetical protein
MHDAATKSAKSAPVEAQDLEVEIRRRAYELYELRGREDGHDAEDWLRAQEEVTRSRRKSAA